MTSFLRANLPSDDETDADYAPKLKENELIVDIRSEGASQSKSLIDPEAAAKVEALWQTLQSSTKRKKSRQAPPTVQWNPTFTSPKKTTGAARRIPTEKATQQESSAETDAPVAEVAKGKLGKRPRGSGVDALLASLQKKKKATVLDSTKQDWRAFKEAHNEDAEELQAHHKSAEPFLEKQEFLTKAAAHEHKAEIDRKQKRLE